MFTAFLKNFRRDHKAQDVAEYSLVVALASLLALGIFIAVSGNVQNLWNTANDKLSASTPTTTSSAPATASTPAPPPSAAQPAGGDPGSH